MAGWIDWRSSMEILAVKVIIGYTIGVVLGCVIADKLDL